MDKIIKGKTIRYRFICRICKIVFEHASEIQDHLMDEHKLSFEETYNPEWVKSEKRLIE